MVPNYGTPALTLVRGQGSTVHDTNGEAYIDLLGGIATAVLGHSHPAVIRAVTRQVQELAHVSNLYAHPQALRLADRLSRRTYGHKALFVNSGTEANEAALKLMRRKAHAEGRPDAIVLAFEGSFHGRTAGALALTGQPHHQHACGPLPGNIMHIPFNDAAALRDALDDQDVVGIFAECIQGEGGIHPMSDEFAAALAARNSDVLLAVDEVQTGVGRTGKFHAHEHWDLRPDIVTMAKGLGGGLPIGAMLASPEAAAHLDAGSHGCTFGGNPVAAAAANAVLDTLDAEDLTGRAHALGTMAKNQLEAAGLDVRGRGLLLGIAAPEAAKAMAALQESGILVGAAGQETLRLAPALNIPQDVWLQGLKAVAQELA